LVHHGANRSVVIHQQNSVRELPYGRSHAAPPLATTNDRVLMFIFGSTYRYFHLEIYCAVLVFPATLETVAMLPAFLR